MSLANNDYSRNRVGTQKQIIGTSMVDIYCCLSSITDVLRVDLLTIEYLSSFNNIVQIPPCMF